MSARPNLLFLTPMQPNRSGSGSAIRAGAVLEALARHFNVYVLCVPLFVRDPVSSHTEFVAGATSGQYCYEPATAGDFPVQQLVAEHFPGVELAAIHTFRLVLARAALAMNVAMHAECFSVLDLDDDEMQRCERSMELRDAIGDAAGAQLERDTLPRLRLMERILLPRFSAVTLASELSCEAVRRRAPGVEVACIPNAVFPPLASPPATPHPPTLLFVGTLGYLPNEDALHYFCTQVLPRISDAVRVRMVGASPTPRLMELARHPGVEIIANVPDLAPYYADADAVIVPLRAGSGTRIKILEAFSFRKPVVSTSIGAEGLDVADGRELLLADDPATFAAACVRLLEDARLRDTLTQFAWEFLQAHHSIDAVDAAIQRVYATVL